MAASSVLGASQGVREGGRGWRAWWEGKGLGYRETGAGEGSRFTTKTDDGPRRLGPEGGGRGREKAPGSGKDRAARRPERSPDAGCGNKGPSLSPRGPFLRLPSLATHADGHLGRGPGWSRERVPQPPRGKQRCWERAGTRAGGIRTLPRAWRAPEGVSGRHLRSWRCPSSGLGRGLVGSTFLGKRAWRCPGPLTSCRARRRRPRSGRAVAGS